MTTPRFLKAAALHRRSEPTGPDLSNLTEREQQILFRKYWNLWVPTPEGYLPARELSERDWETVDFDYVPPREPEAAPDAGQAAQEAIPPPPAEPPAAAAPAAGPAEFRPPPQWFDDNPNVRWRARTTAEDFYFLYAAHDDQDHGY